MVHGALASPAVLFDVWRFDRRQGNPTMLANKEEIEQMPERWRIFRAVTRVSQAEALAKTRNSKYFFHGCYF
jgi:hypothetical protein